MSPCRACRAVWPSVVATSVQGLAANHKTGPKDANCHWLMFSIFEAQVHFRRCRIAFPSGPFRTFTSHRTQHYRGDSPNEPTYTRTQPHAFPQSGGLTFRDNVCKYSRCSSSSSPSPVAASAEDLASGYVGHTTTQCTHPEEMC